MGVTGLWQILQPCGRPIKIDTLNRKRLAVDASIWIYQFLKAVRDKEGNALRNSHVVGFFRRICKLLFFGIKPVFVFDGGAPALKRQTVNARKRRREGRRDDAVRTAGKLLAVQMQRRAEEEEQKRKSDRAHRDEEEVVPEEGLVYVDELQMSAQEREKNRKFRKKDAYHLPELDVSMSEMGGPNDMRVMSLEELQRYASQFESGEDINVYDFSKIDYDSPFFMSLPASDRYNILNAARLRSRLRMGHSKEQLDSMFPDRMAFSRFQIERVAERNELTTRLMNINDGDILFKDGVGGSNRIAGEKAREYVLVKNDGVEGGWALGVIGEEGTRQDKAIDLDAPVVVPKDESEDEDDAGFEDVPIEGLNRLPKRRKLDTDENSGVAKQYRSKNYGVTAARRRPRRPRKVAPQNDDPESLFVADEPVEGSDEEAEEWEDLDATVLESHAEDEEEDLRRAIAMSLENDPNAEPELSEEQANALDTFQQRAADEARPVPKGNWRAIAAVLNNRAGKIAPAEYAQETFSFGVPVPKPDVPPAPSSVDGDEDDAMDFQAALAESRRGKRKASPPPRRQPAVNGTSSSPATGKQKKTPFGGPLPFEKLDLGISIFGKKKTAVPAASSTPAPMASGEGSAEQLPGGFESMEHTERELQKQKEAGPMPPWFSEGLDEGMQRQRELEQDDRDRAREFNKQFQFTGKRDGLKRQQTGEVIDLDSDDEPAGGKGVREIIDLDAEDEPPVSKAGGNVINLEAEEPEASGGGGGFVAPELTGKPVDDEVRMGDMAEAVRTEPPTPPRPQNRQPISAQKNAAKGPFAEESDDEDSNEPNVQPSISAPLKAATLENDEEEGSQIEWSESEDERPASRQQGKDIGDAQPAGGARVPAKSVESPRMVFEGVDSVETGPSRQEKAASRSASPAFEDVDMAKRPAKARVASPGLDAAIIDDPAIVDDEVEEEVGPAPASGLAPQQSIPEDDDYFDDFDDPEEEELLKALATEAEEHARFASTLNNKSVAESYAEYEKELKQLRNQQKKDRRDADEVTHIMIQECQQLLRLFGLPYVTAPMEAEAQCAELVSLGLVDGIVTDDSDCFLFGGTRVYKNFFNQAKFVECYLASDLEKEFNLTRDHLISVAHLLGSDYTEGLPGVGPVTALEIISEFSDGLTGFRDWLQGVQMNTITKQDDAGNAWRKKFRKNATKLFLPPSFPDPRVSIAYKEPEVDSSPQPFQWGVPDLDALRNFLMATIGWSQERTDEVLVPVIRDMNRRADEGTQANITAFFDGGVGIGAAGRNEKGEAFAPRKRVEGSKRMGKALGRMAEKAKVQRTITRAEEPERVDMSAVEAPVNGADEEVGQDGTSSRKGKKRGAAAEASSEDGSEFEAPRTKKGRKKAVPAGRGGKAGRGRKRRAAVDEEA